MQPDAGAPSTTPDLRTLLIVPGAAPADGGSAPATIPAQHLHAPDHWRCIDIVADLHLQRAQPRTLAAWTHYLTHSTADAILILGDLFEVWVGDDALDDPHSFESACAIVLERTARRRPVYFMAGNRDFLLGPRMMRTSAMQPLADPTLLHWHALRLLLSHGDALCLGDVAYQRFRAISRNPAWQAALLARPLSERRLIGQNLRSESQAQQATGAVYADADAALTAQWLDASAATHLIHGHTHRPATHSLSDGRSRIVLSDWHLDEPPSTTASSNPSPRAEILRLTPDRIQRLCLHATLPRPIPGLDTVPGPQS